MELNPINWRLFTKQTTRSSQSSERRNPYAHVALKVKNEFGLSYKDIPDEKINDVINYLNSIKKNEG